MTSTPPAMSDQTEYLQPSRFVDSDHPDVIAYAGRVAAGAQDPVDKAVRLFYAVRDDIRYSAYGIQLDPNSLKASNVLDAGYGWCVNKSSLLAAVCRAAGIPCRLGYADVRNHLATEKLLQWIGTDVFYFHGYNELWLEGRWVKATVAFNRRLCEKARLHPLEFDGRSDSLYHPFDLEGRRHMEYLNDRGHYFDVPYEEIVETFSVKYPMMREAAELSKATAAQFEAEIEAEAAREAARGEDDANTTSDT